MSANGLSKRVLLADDKEYRTATHVILALERPGESERRCGVPASGTATLLSDDRSRGRDPRLALLPRRDERLDLNSTGVLSVAKSLISEGAYQVGCRSVLPAGRSGKALSHRIVKAGFMSTAERQARSALWTRNP